MTAPLYQELVEALRELDAVLGDTPMPDCATMNRLIAASSRARSALSRAQSVEGEGQGTSGAESAAQGTDSLAATDAVTTGGRG